MHNNNKNVIVQNNVSVYEALAEFWQESRGTPLEWPGEERKEKCCILST
jgi:hypothetical protein